MTLVKKLGVKRLRSLHNIESPIELRAITLLLGKNSAGKSTFARILPLLRQSSEKRKKSPILWFGDLVDFGSIGESITRGESDVEFSFSLDLKNNSLYRNSRRFGSIRTRILHNNSAFLDIGSVEVHLTIEKDPENESARAKRLKIKIAGAIVDISFGGDTMRTARVTISGIELPITEGSQTILIEQGAILPKLTFLEQIEFTSRQNTASFAWLVTKNFWQNHIVNAIEKKIHRNTSSETIAKIAQQIPIAQPDTLLRILKKISGPQTWHDALLNEKPSSKFIQQLRDAVLAANLENIIESIDLSLESTLKGVKYLKPLRASAERYYRRVDLSVSEIDPEGKNFPMFLDSLSPESLAEFQEWTDRYLNLRVQPEREGGQVKVLAKSTADEEYVNVADMGFGVSQVLPVAAQIWSSLENDDQETTIVIEQPELHLHPAFQAKLGDIFAGAIDESRSKKGSPELKFLIETHSQHLVNRLGLLIEEKKLRPEDVNIVLFEPSPEKPGRTKTRISTFDNEGVLENWPFGFFEPEE